MQPIVKAMGAGGGKSHRESWHATSSECRGRAVKSTAWSETMVYIYDKENIIILLEKHALAVASLQKTPLSLTCWGLFSLAMNMIQQGRRTHAN